jgi:hypothetical protein
VTTTYFRDTEIDAMCAGLKQNAARVRFLERLGVGVKRKPNGKPRVARERVAVPAPTAGPRWTR